MITTVRRSRHAGLADKCGPKQPFGNLQIEPLPLTTAPADAAADFAADVACTDSSTSSTGLSLSVRLITLGELRCIHNGVDTDLPKQKLRFALLVYLAMERSVPREKVLALLWPEVDEERARRRLISMVFELKQVYPACIDTKGSELHIAEHVTLDARDFGTLADVGEFERALALYQRPFLDGFYLDDAGEFERWVERRRSVIRRVYTHAANAGINSLLEQREFKQAVTYATRWVELEDHNEDAHRSLMLALASAGRPEEALDHFVTLERNLREDEGRRPTETHTELAKKIRDELTKKSDHTGISLRGAPDPIPATVRDPDPQPRPVPWKVVASLAGLIAIAGFFLLNDSAFDAALDIITAEPPADTTRYAAIPFRYASGVKVNLFEQQVINGALSQLEGVAYVDEFLLPSRDRENNEGLTLREARRAARKAGAGRFFFGVAANVGSTFQITIALYNTNTRSTKLGSVIRNVQNAAAADTAIAGAVEELILGPGTNRKAEWMAGTASVPARRAFARGQEAIKDWNLLRADSAFVEAVEHDPDFVEASLWIAQVRSWTRSDPAEWRVAAERAAIRRTQLSWRNGLLAEALLALARGERPTACGLYRTITKADASDFPALYSLAHCLERDLDVVPDPKSPSRWAFRSGYQTALNTFVNAFHQLPSAHRGLSTDLFHGLRELLMTSETSVRVGHRADDSTQIFLSFAGIGTADTIETTPYPAEMLYAGRPETVPSTLQRALAHQRRVFLNIARGWTGEFPYGPEAYLALGIALDLQLNPTAADTVRRARALARTAELQEFLAALEILLRVKSSMPDDLRGLERAATLADSLLRAVQPGKEHNSELLAAIAALMGKPRRAADYYERAMPSHSLPPQLLPVAPRLLVFSALGAPRDSLEHLFDLAHRRLETVVDSAQRRQAMDEWLIRASTLAFGVARRDSIATTTGHADYLFAAQQALLNHDTAAVRRMIGNIQALRAPFSGAASSSDAVYPEAALLVELNDHAGAANWLDRYLDKLSAVALENLDDPIRVGALRRAIQLRIELANRLLDKKTAQRWTRGIEKLSVNAEVAVKNELRMLTTSARW
jgi:DNA-binding SARP family transcriptional activator